MKLKLLYSKRWLLARYSQKSAWRELSLAVCEFGESTQNGLANVCESGESAQNGLANVNESGKSRKYVMHKKYILYV
jgi:hypothetical protein